MIAECTTCVVSRPLSVNKPMDCGAQLAEQLYKQDDL